MKRLHLPRLTRGKKIVRNLLVSLLLLVFAWGCVDFSIGNPYRSFRRAERGEMVGPADYLGDFRINRDSWAVGVYGDQVLLHEEDFVGFDYWPRNETGPTLLPVPESRLLEGQARFVAVDVPEGAAFAELELTDPDGWIRQQEPKADSIEREDIPGGIRYRVRNAGIYSEYNLTEL